MNIMDYFGGKSRAEVAALPSRLLTKIRLWIQANPEYGVAVGVLAGIILVFFFRAVFSLALLAVCVYGVMYFMAKDPLDPPLT